MNILATLAAAVAMNAAATTDNPAEYDPVETAAGMLIASVVCKIDVPDALVLHEFGRIAERFNVGPIGAADMASEAAKVAIAHMLRDGVMGAFCIKIIRQIKH